MSDLNRRTMLKASGVALALPLLESMCPALAREVADPPSRMVFICTTLGLHSAALWPKTTGSEYESTEYLKLLKNHRNDFTLFSGLAHEGQSGRNPHNCEMTWLTAAQGPGLDGFRNTISVDQYAAAQLGNATRFPSITLGSGGPQSQSYNSGGVMIPAETSPANLFAKMFLQGNRRDVAVQKRRLSQGVSIMDQLASQRSRLRRVSSSEDNRQIDEYFDSIRKAENEITESKAWLDRPKPVPNAKQPIDIAERSDLIGRVQLLMNLIPLIVQSDSSRVITVMIQDHKVVPKLRGVSGEHHNLSHHGQEASKIQQLKLIESELVKSFGGLLTQLKSKTEGAGILLDHTSVLFGSNLGNANAHDPKNLPIFLAGGGFKHGNYVAAPKKDDKPLSNLFVTMLQNAGIETDRFAASTGTLDW
ncbi:DUF1552 domain-containing protein [bacterium]|nr:DUF1552 domain-containing protein [bacterium]